ncbi:GTPase IMAP family member 7-like [Cheilinus undulatus]|uniref:GTPase IMAP family member 7-like n=1 Tax=Cheilinus undulatus TaxID=241271 RepID=UPI001BD3AEA8|nr:GTPase IMAP family member 7-like [Cheilinus undulatus]
MDNAKTGKKEPQLRMVLLGKTGCGKSASGNTILGAKCFASKPSSSSVTQECCKETRHLGDQDLTVVDTPGLFNTKKDKKDTMKEIIRFLISIAPGPHAFLWVMKPDSFTREAKDSMEMFKKVFKPARKYTIILFTHKTEEEVKVFIKRNKYVEKFIKQCRGYHVFDNSHPDDDEVLKLVEKINNMVQKNGKPYCSSLLGKAMAAIEELKKQPEAQAAEDPEKWALMRFEKYIDEGIKFLEGKVPFLKEFLDILVKVAEKYTCEPVTVRVAVTAAKVWEQRGKKEPQLRMVLLGKTGCGKSASGNTILGAKCFASKPSSSSVTQECCKETRHLGDQDLTVVDTPGLFNTKKDKKDTMKEIIRFLISIAPGPHAFLWVMKPDSFTREAKDSMEMFKKVFKPARKYTIILFTHKTEEEVKVFIKRNKYVEKFIKQCRGYHVFDNSNPDDDEVLKLVEKINNMVQKNGKPYCSSLLGKAMAAIEELKKQPEAQAAEDSEKWALMRFEKYIDEGIKFLEGKVPFLKEFLDILVKVAEKYT